MQLKFRGFMYLRVHGRGWDGKAGGQNAGNLKFTKFPT